MRVTIVSEDGLVSIDDRGFGGLDLSFIPNTVHAFQWYDDVGEVEYKDERGNATHNETITSLSQFVYFSQCYALWQEVEEKHTAEQAAIEADLENHTEQAALQTGQVYED